MSPARSWSCLGPGGAAGVGAGSRASHTSCHLATEQGAQWRFPAHSGFQSKLPAAGISFQQAAFFLSVKINVMIGHTLKSFSLKSTDFDDEKAAFLMPAPPPATHHHLALTSRRLPSSRGRTTQGLWKLASESLKDLAEDKTKQKTLKTIMQCVCGGRL